MKKDALPIAVGGKKRLHQAVDALVRQAHHEELFKATNPAQKAEIEKTVQREIQEEMKRVASPFSLWNSV